MKFIRIIQTATTVLLGFLLSSLDIYAQSFYQFKNYTINEGLSQSSAITMYQDENHGLWIGTQDGLNRFDGKNFDVYTTDDTKGIESNFIRHIQPDSKDNLWMATSNGLMFRDKKSDAFTTYNLKEGGISIEKIAFDTDGKTIWLATTRKGVWIFNTKVNKFVNKSNIFTSKQLKDIFVSSEGWIFASSEDQPLEAYNPKTGQLKRIALKSKNNNTVVVNFVKQFSSGEVVIGSNQGLFTCSTTTFAINEFLEQITKQFGAINASDILLAQSGSWHVATVNNGLFSLHQDGAIIHSTQDIFQRNTLLYNNINCIFEDKNQTIWIGTSRGISGFNPLNQGFLDITVSANLENGLPSPNVWSVAESPNNELLYIGTDIGVSRFDKKNKRFAHYFRTQLSNNRYEDNSETAVLDVLYINENRLLIGSMDGFYELIIQPNNQYSFKTPTFIDKKIVDAHNRVYHILQYDQNRYFLATKTGVLLVDFHKKTVTEFVNNPKEPKQSILPGVCRMIYKDSKDRIFFATSSGGLSLLDDKNPLHLKIVPYTDNHYISDQLSNYFTSMIEIAPGEFYLGSAGDGIVYWNEKTKKHAIFNKKDGLPNNVVYSIISDKQNNLWISTNKGLAKFNLKSKKSLNFSEVHGLISNEFNMGAGLQSKSGELYFGGIAGLIFFNPQSLNQYNLNVDVVLTKFKLDNKWIDVNDENSPLKQSISYTNDLYLSYKQRSFTIRFQTDNIFNNELLNYKYVLEGDDKLEVELGDNNELMFNSLQSGSYTLKIYARVGFGEWVSQPKVIHIHIKSPFWKTWWFWLSIAAALAIALRIFIRKKIAEEKREQVRLEMKIAERTAEIREKNLKIEKQNETLELQSQQLAIEKEKSERLLRNLIPDSMADELLEKGEASARAFKVVSVMFTDFVGFTKITNNMPPSDLVKRLDIYFRKFDEIVFNNNLERIKTIGDAYMAAGGVPVRNNTNPIDTVLAGLQIQHYIQSLEQESIDAGEEPWKLRLGINTGEVTAGIIGSKRLAYDVWGATVNYAQRMEMLGNPGKVTITKNTYLHIEPYFECTFKGLVSAKGEEKIEMFQVERIKPELSVDGKGIYPNERFHKIVNLHHYSSINYYKAERFIMKKLEKELSDKLHYHSIGHTKDVVQAVERLALSENVTDEGLFLLKTAASYHDAGFVEQYEKNEPIGVRMASEILPKYGYTQEHIDAIKALIFVTSVPHKPTNLLEEIICDADLDYLGRDDFHEIADRLRLELREHGKIDSDRKWDEIQVHFLTQHIYFTETAKMTRDRKKALNLQDIKDRLERNEYKD
jgi:ligand-binding sensor domain-containing protein/class 3 adenylate cyclase/predicted metal-dependent HD superfamily phosphohydrolase